jgi:hypothetical protein
MRGGEQELDLIYIQYIGQKHIDTEPSALGYLAKCMWMLGHLQEDTQPFAHG